MPHPQKPFEDEGTLRTDEQQDPSTRYSRAEREYDPANPPVATGTVPKDAKKRTRAQKVLRTDEGEAPSQAIRDAYQDS